MEWPNGVLNIGELSLGIESISIVNVHKVE